MKTIYFFKTINYFDELVLHCFLVMTYQGVVVIINKHLKLNNDAINIRINVKFKSTEFCYMDASVYHNTAI